MNPESTSMEIIYNVHKRMQANNHGHTALEPREQVPQSTLHIISFPAKHTANLLGEKGKGRETTWLSNPVTNACQECF